MKAAKRAVLRVLAHPWVLPVFRPMARGMASVLMLHRFRDDGRGTPGHDPRHLRRHLEFLRRHRFELLGLREAIERLQVGTVRGPAVVFTIDDGYADFARVAAPTFAAYDCPVTVFVASGFIDGECWYWWDKIAHMIERTQAHEVRASGLPGISLRLDGAASRAGAVGRLVEAVKHMPEDAKEAMIAEMAEALEIPLPVHPPLAYAPLSWDECRVLAGAGVTFGPHTVTHPILSRVSDEMARHEIVRSWARVRTEMGAAAVPVFCYPVGTSWSFTERDRAFVREEGFLAALSAEPGYASAAACCHDDERWALPRFAYSDDGPTFRQIVGGLEHAKAVARSALRLR